MFLYLTTHKNMSTTIYIRVNGVTDSIPIDISDKTTIGEIKDHLILGNYAVDRNQIRLAYLGNIITSEHDHKTLFSMDNCSGMLINGKTIHAVIEKWSSEKIAQYKEIKKNEHPVTEDSSSEEIDYNEIITKISMIYEFVDNVENHELVKALYLNGINKLIDDILVAFDKKEFECQPIIKTEVLPIIEHVKTQLEKDKEIYVIQLKLLADFGFDNVEKNIIALKNNNGNVELVTNNFLDNGY